MSIDEDKSRLRDEAKPRRDSAHASAGPETAQRLCDALASVFDVSDSDDAMVSGYWPLTGELDVRPLLAWAEGRGCAACLPVVVGRDRPLVFRRWRDGDPMDSGTFGTHHPPSTADVVRPDVVLAPLLAFDAAGYRIGWGGGYYDRSLAELRAAGPVLAIGIAYAAQLVDAVPHDHYDQPLDWVVTEERAIRMGAS
jgi:5-formyltetrahydrofolate cyclo-ligase